MTKAKPSFVRPTEEGFFALLQNWSTNRDPFSWCEGNWIRAFLSMSTPAQKAMFQFERVVCVSLARRPDRWKKFNDQLPSDWPFQKVERYDAVDGSKCPSPHWWGAGNGAWGCLKSHMNILEECLQNDIESCLFLEDDAVCCDGFSDKAKELMRSLPDDWGMLYFGGQHLWPRKNPPVPVNEKVYIPFNVNRTHAFAIRGRKTMRKIYQHLNESKDWHDTHHIDHHLGKLHERREIPVYCSHDWLIGQDEGRSNICGKQCEKRFFPSAKDYQLVFGDFVAIVGLPNSGADEIALMLKDLGVHIGHEFLEPKNGIGVSARPIGLAAICESAFPFPSQRVKCWEGTIRCGLVDWIRPRSREAALNKTIAAGYVPQLCLFASILESTIGSKMKTIVIDRPLNELNDIIQEQYPYKAPTQLSESLALMEEQRIKFAESTNTTVLRLQHADIVSDRCAVRESLASFVSAVGRKQDD